MWLSRLKKVMIVIGRNAQYLPFDVSMYSSRSLGGGTALNFHPQGLPTPINFSSIYRDRDLMKDVLQALTPRSCGFRALIDEWRRGFSSMGETDELEWMMPMWGFRPIQISPRRPKNRSGAVLHMNSFNTTKIHWAALPLLPRLVFQPWYIKKIYFPW